MDGPTESEGYCVSEFSDFVEMMLSRSAQGVSDPDHATGLFGSSGIFHWQAGIVIQLTRQRKPVQRLVRVEPILLGCSQLTAI